MASLKKGLTLQLYVSSLSPWTISIVLDRSESVCALEVAAPLTEVPASFQM